jgi:hypothetical protein
MKAKEYFIEELSGEPLTQESVIEGLENYSQQIAIEYSTWLFEWCEYNKYRKLIYGVKPYGSGDFISDKDMFQKFLKTKQ